MASPDEVANSLKSLAETLAASSPEPGTLPDRTIVCVVPDIEAAYRAELRASKLRGIRTANGSEQADVRITADSDDLVALIEGRLSLASAFLTGRVRVEASTRDLMMLRRLL